MSLDQSQRPGSSCLNLLLETERARFKNYLENPFTAGMAPILAYYCYDTKVQISDQHRQLDL